MGGFEALDPTAIARVEQLFRGGPAVRTQGNSLNRAAAVTNLFSIFFVHAIPFDRTPLRNVWNDCQSGDGLASTCHAARLRANRRLDRFELPRAGP